MKMKHKQIHSEQRVDELIQHFWKNGYLTLSRRFGTYLPEPKRIGKYEIDAVGKYKKKVVIGIILKDEEINDPKIISKIEFLATRQTKYSKRRVTLYLGTPQQYLNKVRILVKSLSEEAQKSIKIIPLRDELVN